VGTEKKLLRGIWRYSLNDYIRKGYEKEYNNFSILVRFFVALRPNAGHGPLILEVYRSHTGLLWTSDQLVAETST